MPFRGCLEEQYSKIPPSIFLTSSIVYKTLTLDHNFFHLVSSFLLFTRKLKKHSRLKTEQTRVFVFIPSLAQVNFF